MNRFVELIGRRRIALVYAVLVVLVGMAFSLWWSPVVRHHADWLTPGDLWATFRAAHYVGWGDISDIYQPSTGLIVLPGIAVLLAPVAMLTGALNLTESFPFALPHPTAWLVLGPVVLMLGTTVLFACDALAETLGIRGWRRVGALGMVAVIAWPLAAVWGHPELLVSLAFGIYGLRAAIEGRTRRSAWLIGFGIAFQPVALLLLPVVLAVTPAGQRVRNVVRAALPAAALVAIPLAESWRDTTFALIHQPAYPRMNHATPLLSVTPRLSSFGRVPIQHLLPVVVNGVRQFKIVTTYTRPGEVVSPGMLRSIAVLVAVGLGFWAFRHRPTPEGLVWMSAVALASWCLVEPVMTPYYVVPALALVLVASAPRPGRFALCAGCGGFLTVWTEWFFSPWLYWLPVVATLALALIAARPHPLSAPLPTPQVFPSTDTVNRQEMVVTAPAL